MPSFADMTSNDHRLIEEAFSRVARQDAQAAASRTLVVDAMADAIRRGRRDIFTLVRTGRRRLQQR